MLDPASRSLELDAEEFEDAILILLGERSFGGKDDLSGAADQDHGGHFLAHVERAAQFPVPVAVDGPADSLGLGSHGVGRETVDGPEVVTLEVDYGEQRDPLAVAALLSDEVLEFLLEGP